MPPASSSARADLTLGCLADAAAESPSDRRVHPRLTLSELEWLNGVRLKYGPAVSLIDLSTGGVQIESSNRLQPGSTVIVQIASPDGEVAVPSSVLRCQVSRVVPYTTYRSSLSFKRAFDPPKSGAARGSDAIANLVREHARIAAALRMRAGTQSGLTPVADAACEAALAATLAMIESAPTRAAGARFRQHMTQVFRSLTRDIELGTAPDVMFAALAERLRRSVPAKTIRVVRASGPAAPHSPDTICLDAVAGDTVTSRLVVEFPPNCRLEDWHMPFLKTAAQLVACVGEIAHLRRAEAIGVRAPAASLEPVAPKMAARDATLISAWEAVVVRYVDGRVLKGHSRNFFPGNLQLQVWPSREAPQSSAITVPLRHLKAVFFVHDLEATTSNAAPPAVAARGRKIVVTFLDGEALSGTTLNYSAEGPGFFVSPSDELGNHTRVFAVNGAVRHVQFP